MQLFTVFKGLFFIIQYLFCPFVFFLLVFNRVFGDYCGLFKSQRPDMPYGLLDRFGGCYCVFLVKGRSINAFAQDGKPVFQQYLF